MRWLESRSSSLILVGAMLLGPFTGSVSAGDTWPGLRGPSYDGAVHDARLFDGDSGELTLAWRKALGSGYSVVVTDGERLVTGFQSGSSDFVGAFDPATGEELWRYRVGEAYKGHSGSHDGPIATPALAAGRVHGLGPRGDLFTLDAATGEALWTKRLVEDLGAEAPFYGFASSPLVAEGVLVVAIGAGEGKAVGGFDPETGEPLWTAGTDSIRYQSPVVLEVGGRDLVVAVGNKTVMGLDPVSGEIAWLYEHDGDERDMGGNTIVPIPAGEGRILLLNAHPTSVMLEIRPAGGTWEVAELWSGGSIKSTYVQPVYHEGFLYGMNSKIFTCVDAATGETVWRSREPGDGFPTIVGDHLVIMEKPGTLHVAELSTEGYDEVARLHLFDEHSWTAPAYAGGSLFLRSMGQLARVDLASTVEAGGESASWVGGTEFGRFLAAVEAADDRAKVIDDYLARQSSFPVVGPSGAVHFVYRGEARDVGIVGDMIGYRREDPMIRVAGTDLFTWSTRLEADAAVTYGFVIDYGEPVPDPLNPRQGSGLFGDVSWLAMPARRASDFLGEADRSRQGSMESVEWESPAKEGQLRRAEVYLPAGFDPEGDRSYPVVYVLRGGEALEEGLMKNALDHLVGDSVELLIAVFVMADSENPRGDMQPAGKFVEMLVGELVPLIDERYPTRTGAMERAIVGTGSAGDTAIAAAFSHPDVIGRVGTLWPVIFGGHPEIPDVDEHPLVIFHAWGTYHLRAPHEAWDQVVGNRVFWSALREAGYRPSGGEVPEGVGWSCWRDHMDETLQALFPLAL